MTEERRMITIDYQSWYDQNFIIPDWVEMEIAPPKDWRPVCFSDLNYYERTFDESIARDSCKLCIWKKECRMEL